MNCRGCNTRVPPGAKSCPHCGAEVRNDPGYTGPTRSPVLPAPGLSAAREPEDDYVELDEMTDDVEPIAPVTPRTKQRPAARKRPAPKPASSRPMLATDAAGLRLLLAEQPEMLEPGLEVYADSEGTPLGAGYASGVGDIDLLARSGKRELVVVMICARGDDGEELVAEVLQRIGWVRKHVASPKDRVRGIVLCEQAPESLTYTAAAVADTVQFKTFRVALTFEDLEF